MAHTSTYQITSTAQEKKYIAKSSSATGTNLLLDLVKIERLHLQPRRQKILWNYVGLFPQMDIPTKKTSPHRGRESRCKNLSLRRILRDGRGKRGGKNLLKIFHAAKIQISENSQTKTKKKVDRYRITQNGIYVKIGKQTWYILRRNLERIV